MLAMHSFDDMERRYCEELGIESREQIVYHEPIEHSHLEKALNALAQGKNASRHPEILTALREGEQALEKLLMGKEEIIAFLDRNESMRKDLKTLLATLTGDQNLLQQLLQGQSTYSEDQVRALFQNEREALEKLEKGEVAYGALFLPRGIIQRGMWGYREKSGFDRLRLTFRENAVHLAWDSHGYHIPEGDNITIAAPVSFQVQMPSRKDPQVEKDHYITITTPHGWLRRSPFRILLKPQPDLEFLRADKERSLIQQMHEHGTLTYLLPNEATGYVLKK